uniref:Cyclic nucleotide-binding domain-containing protein n=1 Tax=Globisporangium ultimum (strain ATCC 200006 / CBS 805.95 / DAOM BR144) TaxID=431595 RepID=K3X563_GLOUD
MKASKVGAENDDLERKARDTPAPSLQHSNLVRRVMIAPARRKLLNRRYSAGHESPRGIASTLEQPQNELEANDGGRTSGTTASHPTSTSTTPSTTPRRLKEILQSKVAAKRRTLLPSSSTSFFAAAMAVAGSTSSDGSGGEGEANAELQYEEMMERFQIRRLQHTLLTGRIGTGTGTNSDSGSGSVARSGKVIPGDAESVLSYLSQGATNQRTTPPQSLSSASTLANHQHKDAVGPAASSSRADTAVVIKPRATLHQTHQVTTVASSSGTGSGSGSTRNSRFSWHWTFVALKRKLRHAWHDTAAQLTTPLSPFSTASRVRGVVLLLVFLVHALNFPIQIAFSQSRSDEYRLLYDIDIVTEVVFVVNFLLSFNTSFIDKRGALVTNRREIAWHYLKGWCFLDFIAAVPVEFITWLTIGNSHEGRISSLHILFDGIFRTQRLVQIVRMFRMISIAYVSRSPGKSIWAWLLYSRYSHLLRILWIVVLIVLIAHYMACCWKLLAVTPSSLSIVEQYAENFNDALQLLQGQGLETKTAAQNVFASFAVVLGSIMLAVVFGNVAMLVSNFNANSTNYQRKMESVFAVMSKLQLPALLRERIHQYYEHLWREYESLDSELVKFAKNLTHNLSLEVVLFKYMDLVMNVPFWHECSPDFQKQLVLHLQVRVYLPDDFILRRGEVGDEFYMINRGSCELTTGPNSFEQATAPLHPPRTAASDAQRTDASRCTTSGYYGNGVSGTRGLESIATDDDDRTENERHLRRSRLRTERTNDGRIDNGAPSAHSQERAPTSKLTRLIRGQAFGEIALVMNYERTANVRAMTYVEMCVLTRTDFQMILTRYPEDRRHVISKILTTCMERNEARDVFCPLKDAVMTVFTDRSRYDATTIETITAKHAASIIERVVNPEVTDSLMKFGFGAKLKRDLIKLKEQENAEKQRWKETSTPFLRLVRRGPAEPGQQRVDVVKEASALTRSTAGATVSTGLTALESRMQTLETTQNRILRQLHDMHSAINDLRPGLSSVSTSSSTPREMPHEPEVPVTVGSMPEQIQTNEPQEVGARVDNMTAQDRPVQLIHFIRNRSSSMPNVHALLASARIQNVTVSDDNAKNDVAATGPPAEVPSITTRRVPLRATQGHTRATASVPAGAIKITGRRCSVTLRDLNEQDKQLAQTITPATKLTIKTNRWSPFKLRRRASQNDEQRRRRPEAQRGSASALLHRMSTLMAFASAVTSAGGGGSGSSASSFASSSPTCYADQLFQTRGAANANGASSACETTQE